MQYLNRIGRRVILEKKDTGMTIKSGDPKLGAALDAVSEALKKIYDAKRDGTATANDDIRLKKLHVEWMAIMRKISDGETEDLRQPTIPAAQNESRDSSFLARLRESISVRSELQIDSARPKNVRSPSTRCEAGAGQHLFFGKSASAI